VDPNEFLHDYLLEFYWYV